MTSKFDPELRTAKMKVQTTEEALKKDETEKNRLEAEKRQADAKIVLLEKSLEQKISEAEKLLRAEQNKLHVVEEKLASTLDKMGKDTANVVVFRKAKQLIEDKIKQTEQAEKAALKKAA